MTERLSRIQQMFDKKGRKLLPYEVPIIEAFNKEYAKLLIEAVDNMEERRIQIENSKQPDPFPFLNPRMMDEI